MHIIERRIMYLAGARLRERDRMIKAMERQDMIRRKHPAAAGWDSVSVIRRWREAR
ncbi:MAG TPA: hypothetical protein PKY93_09625 [Methanothrix sp.]|nr:hypothetical protein [Methanothrix sp.]